MAPAFKVEVAKNAIEMATSSDIARVIAMDSFAGNEDEPGNDDANNSGDDESSGGYRPTAAGQGSQS